MRSLVILTTIVSIHAPQEGCDRFRELRCRWDKRFNSRTPGGVRPPIEVQMMQANVEFQFTHPRRGATLAMLTCLRFLDLFQFTHPRRGATRRYIYSGRTILFQFTHPRRGATRTQPHIDIEVRVSIHAPQEGCDYTHFLCSTYVPRFNSRTPGGVRPDLGKEIHYTAKVSIHAPQEGCDWL